MKWKWNRDQKLVSKDSFSAVVASVLFLKINSSKDIIFLKTMTIATIEIPMKIQICVEYKYTCSIFFYCYWLLWDLVLEWSNNAIDSSHTIQYRIWHEETEFIVVKWNTKTNCLTASVINCQSCSNKIYLLYV